MLKSSEFIQVLSYTIRTHIIRHSADMMRQPTTLLSSIHVVAFTKPTILKVLSNTQYSFKPTTFILHICVPAQKTKTTLDCHKTGSFYRMIRQTSKENNSDVKLTPLTGSSSQDVSTYTKFGPSYQNIVYFIQKSDKFTFMHLGCLLLHVHCSVCMR